MPRVALTVLAVAAAALPGCAVGHAAVERLARDRALIAAMRGDRPAALRAAALRQLFNPGKHVVRLRV